MRTVPNFPRKAGLSFVETVSKPESERKPPVKISAPSPQSAGNLVFDLSAEVLIPAKPGKFVFQQA